MVLHKSSKEDFYLTINYGGLNESVENALRWEIQDLVVGNKNTLREQEGMKQNN